MVVFETMLLMMLMLMLVMMLMVVVMLVIMLMLMLVTSVKAAAWSNESQAMARNTDRYKLIQILI